MTAQVAPMAPWRPATLRHHAATSAAVALAVVLSASIYWLVVPHHSGSIPAGIAALAMTAPVAYGLRWPSAAGVSLAAGAALNELFFGHLVRCGPALPATFFVAFVGGYLLGRQGWLALSGSLVSVCLQCVFDPNLGAAVMTLMVPITLAFFAAGLYVRRRAALVDALRATTRQLADQREQTAKLAVAADREVITGQLDLVLQQRLDSIEELSRAAEPSHERFAAIEQLGRQTLDGMRDVLGSLRDSPIEPEPGLAELAGICSRATTADVRLTIDGSVRPLPASIELSACRIVEQLVRLLADEPSARVQLRVDFAVSSLDIALSGSPTAEVDLLHVRSLADARAAVHGGTVDIIDGPGLRSARVCLPLMAIHA